MQVLSCFEVKPRRRRGIEVLDENGEPLWKAFRLCIPAEDRGRLLDAALWPDSVLISDCFFKPQADRDNDDKRRRVGDQPNRAALSSVASPANENGAHAATVVTAQIAVESANSRNQASASLSSSLADSRAAATAAATATADVAATLQNLPW